MPKSAKRHLIFAFFAVLLGFGLVRADVKLRIYLKDGSLQSGNLVTEGASSFVILAKDGRVEVPKNQIMFVNGKTLLQWEAQPNKNYQTEILPTEVPKPAYVNDKAAPPLPIKPYSPIKGVIPASEEVKRKSKEKAKPEETFLEAASNDEPLTPLQSEEKIGKKPLQENDVKPDVDKIIEKSKTQAVVPVSKPPKRQARRKNVVPPVRKPAVNETAPQAALEEAKPAEVVLEKPKGFSREALSEYHYNEALGFLKKDESGNALHQLHLAAILNRGSEKAVLLLGKTYFEEGVFPKAEKFLGSTLLRKNDEAKKLLADISEIVKHRERKPWVLSGAAVAGFFGGTIPLLFLIRRLTGASRKKVISDEKELDELIREEQTLQTLKPAPAVAELASSPEKISPLESFPPEEGLPPFPPKLEIIKEEMAELFDQPADILPLVSKKEESEVKEAAKEPPTLEAAPPTPSSGLETKPTAPEIPPLAPAKPPATPPVSPSTEELIKKLQRPVEPPKIAHEVPLGLPEPVAAKEKPPVEPGKPKFEVVQPDTNEVLERAALVDYAIQRGNELAAAGEMMKAEREYRTAIALNPECLAGYVGLGFVCFMNGQWEMALEFYVKALTINPESPDAHYGIGRVLLETNRETEAVHELQKALSLDPTFTDARDTLTYLGKLV